MPLFLNPNSPHTPFGGMHSLLAANHHHQASVHQAVVQAGVHPSFAAADAAAQASAATQHARSPMAAGVGPGHPHRLMSSPVFHMTPPAMFMHHPHSAAVVHGPSTPTSPTDLDHRARTTSDDDFVTIMARTWVQHWTVDNMQRLMDRDRLLGSL